MGSLSKDSVMEAIQKQKQADTQEPETGIKGAIGKLKGMLNPKSGPGALANRQEYLKYVDEQQGAGKEALSYGDWAQGK